MPDPRDIAVSALREAAQPHRAIEPGQRDPVPSWLEEGLTLTPWERMQANDDILNFGESLRAAMEKHHAKPQ
jgi:hypothetical protein